MNHGRPPGYIDPALGRPQCVGERRIYDAVRVAGLRMRALSDRGRAVCIEGPGVHVTAAQIRDLHPSDLRPLNADDHFHHYRPDAR